jgi:hypothetical protein
MRQFRNADASQPLVVLKEEILVMTKWVLAAGAAALAITSPALADRGGGHGGGKGGGQASQVNTGGGGNAHAAKADRGGGGNARASKADRGGGGHARIANSGGGGHAAKADRGSNHQMHSVQRLADRGHDNKQSHAIRVSGFNDQGKNRGHADRGIVRVQDNNRIVVGSRDFDKHNVRTVRIDDNRFNQRFASIGTRGLIDGCPPGLAKKNNGCMPPGQYKKFLGTRWSEPLSRGLLPASYRTWYPDNNDYLYREREGYVYRIDRNGGLINGLFPMFANDGNYFNVGQRYPLDYGFYNVPMQYQPYYADNNDYLYRYGDGGIYQVNRSNGLISGIAALLAGDFGVGQRLPMGYGAYNVPLGYRDQYYDTADNWYRYNDGNIYRVDPTTQLVTAVISALI